MIVANVKASYKTKIIHKSNDDKYPACGGAKLKVPYVKTNERVTCKKCLGQ